MMDDLGSVPDYTDHLDTGGDTVAAELCRLVDQLTEIDRRIEEGEARLTAHKNRRRQLVEHEIPDVMARVGAPEMKLPNGFKVTVKDEVRASMPKDERRPLAFAWLEESGNGGLIDRRFTIKFPREEIAWANRFEADLKKRKRPVDVERTEDVHHQRLLGFLREQIRGGKQVPMEFFGAFIQRIASVRPAGAR